MSDDPIVVHQDTTLNAGKLSIVLPIAGVVMILSAGIMIGTMQSEVRILREETRALRAEVNTRESKDAVALMFGDVRLRLGRIEALLDRSTTTRMP